MLLDDAIDVLTKMMIKDSFKEIKNNEILKVKMTKIDLYNFCIKLLKIIKDLEG